MVFMEAAKFTTLQMYSSLIVLITVDRQILTTEHYGSELSNWLIVLLRNIAEFGNLYSY